MITRVKAADARVLAPWAVPCPDLRGVKGRMQRELSSIYSWPCAPDLHCFETEKWRRSHHNQNRATDGLIPPRIRQVKARTLRSDTCSTT